MPPFPDRPLPGPGAENKGFSLGDAIGTLYIVGACYVCEGCMVHNNHCETSPTHVQGFSEYPSEHMSSCFVYGCCPDIAGCRCLG